MSARYRDQPLAPLELAKYWVTYVARHKGAAHLQSAGQDLAFLAFHNVDVFVFIASSVVFVVYFVWWIVGTLIGLVTRSGVAKKADKKKRN